MTNITATKNRIEGIIAGLTIGTYTEGYKTDDSYIWEIWTDQKNHKRVIVSLHHQTRVFDKGDIRIGIYEGHLDEEATIPTRVWEYEVIDKTDYYINSNDLAKKISFGIQYANSRQTVTA